MTESKKVSAFSRVELRKAKDLKADVFEWKS